MKCPCCTGTVVMVSENGHHALSVRYEAVDPHNGPQCPCCRGPVVLDPASIKDDGTARFVASTAAPASPSPKSNWAAWGDRALKFLLAAAITTLGGLGYNVHGDLTKKIDAVAAQKVEQKPAVTQPVVTPTATPPHPAPKGDAAPP
jgi:hypothetical protein